LDATTLLRLMWLASPALPVGGFSYSEGLESAVETARVTHEQQTGDWLLLQLELSLTRSDASVVAAAHGAWLANDRPRVAALNDWLRQTRESAEQRAQSEQMGRSLADWLRNSEQAGDARIEQLTALAPAPHWPVAYALAGVLASATVQETLLAYSFGWCENMVQAAMKAVPLGQAAAQRVLARLALAVPKAVQSAAQMPDEYRQAFSPMLAVLSAQHETQYSRLFRS